MYYSTDNYDFGGTPETSTVDYYEDELKDPWKMKNMMVDHLKRRHFIIDADIKVIRFHS